ncbi:hypothetical protein T8T21_16085 (plasmid) [Limimaricola variabilis]|uniref:hypothetical protein n=1 Tax=Limimaricola variabilis TaxID=1492771 RepID=UPI002AC8E5BB|nr:hypothetical protein [Limimaricola variabilis]WPY96292.1 hypothetical protein T8T21_16085 [Limimaricola variabilis]
MLEDAVTALIDHDDHHGYLDNLGNLAPVDVYLGRTNTILNRQEIRARTSETRRLLHRQTAA